MKRREFIKKSFGAGIIAGTALSTGNISRIFGQGNKYFNNDFDLVAVKNGESNVMFDKAIEALGGISKFVKKNQTVVVKPNIGWDVVPEKAANTNPLLVKRIIEHCFNAGAKKVYVFDHTCDEWQKCYANSGIKKAAEDAGATVVPAHTESYYQTVNIPKGKTLKSDKIHELILSSDVFINVPILKNHGSAKLTIAMKNLMGINWDRGYWHQANLQQCIADLTTKIKPTLNIVDAYRIMKQNGPRGRSLSDVVITKTLLASTDIVAIDAAASKVFGIEPEDVAHIKIASELGVGNINLDNLNIKRITL